MPPFDGSKRYTITETRELEKLIGGEILKLSLKRDALWGAAHAFRNKKQYEQAYYKYREADWILDQLSELKEFKDTHKAIINMHPVLKKLFRERWEDCRYQAGKDIVYLRETIAKMKKEGKWRGYKGFEEIETVTDNITFTSYYLKIEAEIKQKTDKIEADKKEKEESMKKAKEEEIKKQTEEAIKPRKIAEEQKLKQAIKQYKQLEEEMEVHVKELKKDAPKCGRLKPVANNLDKDGTVLYSKTYSKPVSKDDFLKHLLKQEMAAAEKLKTDSLNNPGDPAVQQRLQVSQKIEEAKAKATATVQKDDDDDEEDDPLIKEHKR